MQDVATFPKGWLALMEKDANSLKAADEHAYMACICDMAEIRLLIRVKMSGGDRWEQKKRMVF